MRTASGKWIETKLRPSQGGKFHPPVIGDTHGMPDDVIALRRRVAALEDELAATRHIGLLEKLDAHLATLGLRRVAGIASSRYRFVDGEGVVRAEMSRAFYARDWQSLHALFLEALNNPPPFEVVEEETTLWDHYRDDVLGPLIGIPLECDTWDSVRTRVRRRLAELLNG